RAVPRRRPRRTRRPSPWPSSSPSSSPFRSPLPSPSPSPWLGPLACCAGANGTTARTPVCLLRHSVCEAADPYERRPPAAPCDGTRRKGWPEDRAAESPQGPEALEAPEAPAAPEATTSCPPGTRSAQDHSSEAPGVSRALHDAYLRYFIDRTGG